MKVLVQCSGGIDSTVLIAKALNLYGRDSIYLISFDDDSIFWHHKDSIAVKRVVVRYQLQQRHFVCRVIQSDKLEYLEDDTYHDVGYIPGYKMLLNLSSLAFAQKIGAEKVWIGNMRDNSYSDESTESVKDTMDLYNRVYGSRISIEAPLFGLLKSDVIRMGMSLGVKFEDTLSCGDDKLFGGYHCGNCEWCNLRKKGFREAGVEDPTKYLWG